MRYCSFCKKTFKNGSGHLFRLPKDSIRRKKWNEICGKNFSPCSLLCSDHFLSTSIIWSAGKVQLMPNAMPNVKKMKSSSMDISITKKNKNFTANGPNNIPNTECNQNLLYLNKNIVPPQLREEPVMQLPVIKSENINLFYENPKDEITSDFPKVNIDVIPPQLQEEPIIQLPVIKSVSCTGFTQTNTRLCGLVQASGYSNYFRLNCFYCSEVFALEKWKDFTTHMKEKHFESEEAFKMFEYVSEDHDYTPINLPTFDASESDVIKSEEFDILNDPLESVQNQVEPDDNKDVSSNQNILNDFIDSSKLATPLYKATCTFNASKPKSLNSLLFKNKAKNDYAMQTLHKTTLSRFLKRTKCVEVLEPKENEEYNSVSIEVVQQRTTEITFQYTPPEIVEFLINTMKNYPVLWTYDYGPFNEAFYDAVECICKIINEKWSLNIDNLKMRRSIIRILRFYCSSFLNCNKENSSKFKEYYDKCSAFLPSLVKDIPYARCPHCYICYGNDFDLKRHLLGEQKYLLWPYMCAQCHECFRDSDDYEFHKLLPHYDISFTCKVCSKKFDRHAVYRKHVSNYHPNDPKEPGEYNCDVCMKVFHTRYSLRNHKTTHGEKKVKCPVCSKYFFTKAHLSSHRKIHRDSNYVCEVCGKAFVLHSGLRQHLKKHSGVKVTCSICNLKLRQSSLGRHLRLVHVVREGLIDKIGVHKHWRQRPRSKREPKKRETYHCKMCDLDIENYKLTVEHYKEIHSDMMRWPCQICCSEFSIRNNLKKHYRKKHKLSLLQVFKLAHEYAELNDVVDELNVNRSISNDKIDDVGEVNTETQIKSDLMPDEILFEADNVHSLTIQDEIINAADNVTRENKADYMNDFFRELLIEPEI